MKTYVLLIISVFYICSNCFGQKYIDKDSIQIYYYKGVDGIGGQDHCITIYFEG